MKKAIRLYQKAVDRDNPDAMRMLGLCYEFGTGVTINIQKAGILYYNYYKKTNDNTILLSYIDSKGCPFFSENILLDFLECIPVFRTNSIHINQIPHCVYKIYYENVDTFFVSKSVASISSLEIFPTT